jgi:hypothetical protein
MKKRIRSAIVALALAPQLAASGANYTYDSAGHLIKVD